jgi:putative hydrolase of the HAD superfamily
MKKIKTIIFDFGGVIINIDYRYTIQAFVDLGIQDFETRYFELKDSLFFDGMETGMITPVEFRKRIRGMSDLTLTDEQIDHAWNAILLDLPKQNIEFLEQLKKRYPLFLLSNTNEIHERSFMNMIGKQFGEDTFDKIFHNVYLSHHLNMRKPDPEIYRYVIKENNLVAGETLFVDDFSENIEAAKTTGLQTFYFEKGKTLKDILT